MVYLHDICRSTPWLKTDLCVPVRLPEGTEITGSSNIYAVYLQTDRLPLEGSQGSKWTRDYLCWTFRMNRIFNRIDSDEQQVWVQYGPNNLNIFQTFSAKGEVNHSPIHSTQSVPQWSQYNGTDAPWKSAHFIHPSPIVICPVGYWGDNVTSWKKSQESCKIKMTFFWDKTLKQSGSISGHLKSY